MAHSVVAESIMVIAVIIAAAFLASAFTSILAGLGGSMAAVESSLRERSLIRVEVVFASNVSLHQVKVWVKNVGLKEVDQELIPKSDLFFGPAENFTRIAYASSKPPSWTYVIADDLDGDSSWDPHETIEVTITWDTVLNPGDYMVKFVAHNGVSDDLVFSIGGG